MANRQNIAQISLLILFSFAISACGKKTTNGDKDKVKESISAADKQKTDEEKLDKEKSDQEKSELEVKQKQTKEKAQLAEQELLLQNKKLLAEQAEDQKKSLEKEQIKLSTEKKMNLTEKPITPAIKQMPKTASGKSEEGATEVKKSDPSSAIVKPQVATPGNDEEIPPPPEMEVDSEKIEICLQTGINHNNNNTLKKMQVSEINVQVISNFFETLYAKCKSNLTVENEILNEKFMMVNYFIIKITQLRPDLINVVESFKSKMIGAGESQVKADEVAASINPTILSDLNVNAVSDDLSKAFVELKVTSITTKGKKIDSESNADKVVYGVFQSWNKLELSSGNEQRKRVTKSLDFSFDLKENSLLKIFNKFFNIESKVKIETKYEFIKAPNQNGFHILNLINNGNKYQYEVKVSKGNINNFLSDSKGNAIIEIVFTNQSWENLVKDLLKSVINDQNKDSVDTSILYKNYKIRTEPEGYARTCNLSLNYIACTDPKYLFRGEN